MKDIRLETDNPKGFKSAAYLFQLCGVPQQALDFLVVSF